MKRKGSFVAALVMLCILTGANSTWGAPGDLLWEITISFLPEYDLMQPGGVAVSSTTCLIHGMVLHSANSIQTMAFIKAVDINTGDTKWERTLSLGVNSNRYDIKVSNNIAYIKSNSASWTGSYPNYTFTLNRTIIGAYDVNTGQAFWEKTKDNYDGYMAQTPFETKIDNKIILLGADKLPVAGYSSNCIVSCYSAGGQGVTAPALNSLLLEK